MALQLNSSLGEIEWIPRPRITQLRRLGLETVGDLLTHYPRRHEDRREFANFPREESERLADLLLEQHERSFCVGSTSITSRR